jgi:mannose-6-phosphate isomerase-like protein (cupin superfamily)
MCGVKGCRYSFTGKESSDLLGLRRGVFAGKPLRTNQQISISDISLAIPLIERQITANDLSKYNELILKTSLDSGQPIMFSDVEIRNNRDKIYEIVQKVKTYLNNTNVVVPGAADLEISHHYGIDRFYEYGITMITVVNRDYCKKLIIVLPGQQHPEQHHEVKEETFHVLDGEIHLVLDGARRICNPGDVIVVERGVKHSFSSPSGAVIEEISSTHLKQDSFYSDPVILQNLDRKTLLTHWMG